MIRTAAIVLLALSCCPPVAALQSDREQQMLITSDHFDGNEAVATFSGDVNLNQGTLVVRAETARVIRNNGTVVRVELDGAPAYFRQRLDDDRGLVEARARAIVYQLEEQKLELRDNVVIDQARGQVTGDLINYDLTEGRIRGGQQDGDGRIIMRINPPAAAGDPGDAPDSETDAVQTEPGSDLPASDDADRSDQSAATTEASDDEAASDNAVVPPPSPGESQDLPADLPASGEG